MQLPRRIHPDPIVESIVEIRFDPLIIGGNLLQQFFTKAAPHPLVISHPRQFALLVSYDSSNALNAVSEITSTFFTCFKANSFLSPVTK